MSSRPKAVSLADDAAFKRLFSDPRMIELLIRRHVPEWADRIDCRTLQPLPTELVDEKLRRRFPDMAWRVRTTDGTTDLLLLLEFQGRPEKHMALRTTIYSCLAIQSLLQSDKELERGKRELAVVPLVNRFMARSVKAMLSSKGFPTQQLEEAMTMGTVVTEFQRGWEEVRQMGREEGREEGQVAVLVQMIARKFGQGTAEEVQQVLGEDFGGDRIAWAADAILDCDKPEDFLAGLRGD